MTIEATARQGQTMLREAEERESKLREDSRLLDRVTEILAQVASDGGTSEGMVECVERIIRERDAARAELATLHEELSEVLTLPQPDGLEWKEQLEDGSWVPVMRGSPNLKAFILKLHNAAATFQGERDAARAELEKKQSFIDRCIRPDFPRGYEPCGCAAEILEYGQRLDRKVAECSEHAEREAEIERLAILMRSLLLAWVNGRQVQDGIMLTMRQDIEAALSKAEGHE